MPKNEKQYKYISSCGRIKPTNNLRTFATHLRFCPQCRQNASPELLEEIKESYGWDLALYNKSVTNLYERETDRGEVKMQEKPMYEENTVSSPPLDQTMLARKEEGTESSPASRGLSREEREILHREVASAPIIQEMKKQLEETLLLMNTIARQITGGGEASSAQTVEEKEPATAKMPAEVSPEEMEEWVRKKRERMGTGGVGGEKPVLEEWGVTNLLKEAKELVAAWRGGKREEGPDPLQQLAYEALMNVVKAKSDPIEYLTKGMELEAKRYDNLLKLLTSGKLPLSAAKELAKRESSETEKPSEHVR